MDRQPEKVHDLRTSICRIEAALEADVLTKYASTLHPAGEDKCSVPLLEDLGAQRQKHAKKLYNEVRRVRPGPAQGVEADCCQAR